MATLSHWSWSTLRSLLLCAFQGSTYRRALLPGRRAWLVGRDTVHRGPYLNVYDPIPFVQIQRHRHVIERRIGRDRNTETLRQIDGKPPRNEGKKSPVEVRFASHLLIVFGRTAAAFSESEIGMTEELLRDWLLPGRIEDLSFESSYPLHMRFFRHAEMDPALDRPGSLHRAINFIQAIRVGHERQNRFLLRVRPSQ